MYSENSRFQNFSTDSNLKQKLHLCGKDPELDKALRRAGWESPWEPDIFFLSQLSGFYVSLQNLTSPVDFPISHLGTVMAPTPGGYPGEDPVTGGWAGRAESGSGKSWAKEL